MEYALSLGSRFFKGHGHGNDYLVFEEGDAWSVTPETVRALCHRTRGVGGDGIVALLSPRMEAGSPGIPGRGSPPSPFRLRMFNPDGSEFERSGNGLRIFAAYLLSKEAVRVGDPFSVEVGGDLVEMEVLRRDPGGDLNIAVEMGKARFGIDAVGGNKDAFGPGVTLRGPDGTSMEVHLVSLGNPHCVLFREDLEDRDLQRLGPHLSGNTAFASGINVQLALPVGDKDVEILIWERGVGRTASSGTSACAVAAACVNAGRLQPGKIRVVMEGGSFLVSVSRDMSVRLEGPVQAVLTGELNEEMLTRLAMNGDGGTPRS